MRVANRLVTRPFKFICPFKGFLFFIIIFIPHLLEEYQQEHLFVEMLIQYY